MRVTKSQTPNNADAFFSIPIHLDAFSMYSYNLFVDTLRNQTSGPTTSTRTCLLSGHHGPCIFALFRGPMFAGSELLHLFPVSKTGNNHGDGALQDIPAPK